MRRSLINLQSLFINFAFLVIFLIALTDFKSELKNDYRQPTQITATYGSEAERLYRDSLRNDLAWKKQLLMTGRSETILMNVVKFKECDNCGSFYDDDDIADKFHDKYFFVLPGYYLDNATFFIEKGKYYLHHTVWDVIYENGRKGHREILEIPIRFAFDPENRETAGSVLIPISKSTYKLLHIPFIIIYIAVGILALYVFLILPSTVLLNIAHGRIFERNNARHLLWVGWGLIGIALIIPVLSVLLNFIFRHKIPNEIVYPFINSIFKNKALLIAGIAVLMLARAFRKGEKLQQEQDLTV